MKGVRKDGVVVWDENDSQENGQAAANESGGKPDAESRGRPEIDRAALRALLLSALPPERIVWGKHVSSLSPVPGTITIAAKGTINFSGDGDSPPQLQPQYDLVLGADRAWSRRHGDGGARCYACVRFRDGVEAVNATTDAHAAVVEAPIAASLGLEEAAETARDSPGVRGSGS
ncbi:hypothetical protein DL768_010259 [Monosporascus sp. mg162]|nr:hypothetical protein DL768_010259 [Monosporascus sp. mg162]